MKYRCSHCSHVFELGDRQFRRCPNCFWTTSLVSLEEAGSQTRVSETVTPPHQTPEAPKPRRKNLAIPLITVGFVGIASFIFFKIGATVPKFSLKFPIRISKPEISTSESNKTAPKPLSSQAVKSLLTGEEHTLLEQPFQITIPRALSADEEEILKKQVSFPASLAKKPTLAVWNKEDFEKMIESEQAKRKIWLGWWYVRSLTKTFEKHYGPAVQAFEEGDYVLAREQFLKSLAFPIYRNDPRRHRAIALVVLRSYLNDVIGKIAVLNQHLLSQNLLTEVHTLFGSYQALFPILELQEWERALQQIEELKKQIAAFENRPSDALVNYPPAFGELDSEVQFAVRTEAAPKPEAAVSLKALTIDLGLKEKIVRANTAGELANAQKQYEQAIQLLKEGNWRAAREKLLAIEHPPELASEAKKKLAVVDKILALEEAQVK